MRSTSMTFTEAYNHLLSLHNLSQPTAHFSGTSLAKIKRLLALLDHPENRITRYVHVTGTSGKGSVCLMIASILQANGERVGMLTSPHITKITERWQINGCPMPDRVFVSYIKRLFKILDDYSEQFPDDFPSYHDILTALGLWYFAESKVDTAVIEVGIGGRFDTTNIIPQKTVAIITSVGRDHLQVIGPTLSDVARHKAGIITPKTEYVISGVTSPKLKKIIQKQAAKAHAAYHPAEKITVDDGLHTTDFTFHGTNYHLPAHGAHQLENAALALEAARLLNIPSAACQQGLAATRFPLRVESLTERPYLFIDGAHNEDKIAATVQAIDTFQTELHRKTGKKPRLHLLIGFSNNKNYHRLLRDLLSLEPITIATTRFSTNPFRKAALPGKLAQLCRNLAPKSNVKPFMQSMAAFDWIYTNAKPNDIILITGSIFLGGELRPLLLKKLRK